MSAQIVSVDTSVLPADVLSLYDDHFYEIVEKIGSLGAAKLLEVQGIREVCSFLNTTDVFDILSISCAALTSIRKSVCLEADDHTYTVKPGCRSSIRYLHQLLHQKHEEHLKEITVKSRRNKQLHVQQNNGIYINLSQDSSQDASTILNDQQSPASSSSTKKINHHDFIIHTLNEWFDKNSSTMNVTNEKLIVDKDFKLTLVCNELFEEAYVSCSCGVKVQLTKLRETFSLSNYYKHLKSKSCMMMKKKRISDCNTNDESIVTTDQEPFDDGASQNNSIANQTQSSTSSISTTTYIDKLLKRSTISETNISSKKRRT